MNQLALKQIVIRVMLAVYVLRLFPVMQYTLRGQVALRSALAQRAAPAALGRSRGTTAVALETAATTAAELAAAAQPSTLVEIVAQDENGPVVLSFTAEHAAIASVSSPFLARKTVFNVTSARWQLETVELSRDDVDDEAAETKGAAVPAPDTVLSADAADLTPATAPTPAAAAAPADADADGAAAPPSEQFLDAVLRFRNARTRKSHLVLCSNADAARIRALHLRAVVRKQLAQIDRDARRSPLPSGGFSEAVLREALVSHALQPPLADRYCQGHNLLCVAIVRALFAGVPGADETAAAESASVFPYLAAEGLAALRAEFVTAGLFPDVAPTARALARLRAQDDAGAAARGWAAERVAAAFAFLMRTQGLDALVPASGGAAADAARGALGELLGRVRGPLATIRAEAERAAAAKLDGEAAADEAAADAPAAADGAADADALARAEATVARAEAEAEAAADQPARAAAAEPSADDATSSPTAAAPASPSAASAAAVGVDVVGALMSAFDPLSALSTLGIAPSSAQLEGGAPSAAEQAHILALWRALLRASSASEAQSVCLKLMGARMLGYCHEVRGRRWTDSWDSSLLEAASIFAEDWSVPFREHLAALSGRPAPAAASVPADRLEWFATTFKSGWRVPELERALLRSRLPSKLGRAPARTD